MPRALKTLYPCVHCGAPSQVGRKSDAGRASCSLCSTIAQYASLARWASERAHEQFKKWNKSTVDPLVLAIRLAPVLEQMMSAAADGLMVAQLLVNPRERAAWVRWSHEHMEWSEDCSSQLRELTKANATAFELILGGLSPAPQVLA